MTPRQIVERWVELFNRQDSDGLAALYADDCINHQIPTGEFNGRQAVREMFAGEFKKYDMVCLVENIFEDGEWAILEWKDPKGLRGCGFFKTSDNQIVFQRGYWDRLTFLEQQES